jgi:ATP-dependent RNA helicase DDX24/MAK5
MGIKREPESTGSVAKSKKRQKVKNPVKTAFLNADELAWTKVRLPDRLDDTGGFYGLEEIDGVEVVRSDWKGQIKFKVCKATQLVQNLGY